jgi:hypothetical protein
MQVIMAKIEGILLRNFRVLRDVTLGKLWNLQDAQPFTPMTTVIDKNGVGKNAFFDSFGFLAAVDVVALAVVVIVAGCVRPQTRHVITPDAEARLTADNIPVAHTPGCGWKEFPPPVLKACSEPLVPEAPDLRGIWEAYEGMVGHIERIEQCGNRIVITSGGVTHDMRADGTLKNGVNDVAAAICIKIRVAAEFINGKLALRPFGGPVAVTRELDGDEMIWSYEGKTSRLRRIDSIPH